MYDERREQALRLVEQLKAQGVAYPVVGMGFTDDLKGNRVPALFVYTTPSQMKRITSTEEFEGTPVIWSVGGGARAGEWV